MHPLDAPPPLPFPRLDERAYAGSHHPPSIAIYNLEDTRQYVFIILLPPPLYYHVSNSLPFITAQSVLDPFDRVFQSTLGDP